MININICYSRILVLKSICNVDNLIIVRHYVTVVAAGFILCSETCEFMHVGTQRLHY